ncbi:hypothetical protein BVY03_02665 [bacterium K02(2017)]|nr:hypothetical protein BVY03_02665 [bacterium K02(2017)]
MKGLKGGRLRFCLRHIKQLLSFSVLAFILIFSVNCGTGGPGDGLETTGFETDGDSDNINLVDPIFVRTGISSSTVIDQDYRAVVYIGRYLYQEEGSEYELSFNPSKNFLKNLEFE